MEETRGRRKSSCDGNNQHLNWSLAIASLHAVLNATGTRRSTRLADFSSQVDSLLERARRMHEPHLANALDRLRQLAQRELATPSEDFSRLTRLIKYIERIIHHLEVLHSDCAMPLALILAHEEPPEILRDALRRAGFGIRTIVTDGRHDQNLAKAGTEASLIIRYAHPEQSITTAMAPILALGPTFGERTTLMVGAADTFGHRAAAVKAGVSHFLTQPLDIARLNTLLQSARLADEDNRPIHVLMVDDMSTAGIYWGKHFQDENIVFRFESDPEKAYQNAIEMEPDVILLDLYMPELDGMELARIFREQPRLQDVPILFMSSEERDRERFEAKLQGGDDFLNKTIAVQDLLRMVRYRAQRHRQAKAERRTDSLTGLLNHKAIKELIESELDRAGRQNQPLSVALIDLDHFKSVNDNHGHQAGDIVLRRLSNQLNTRLRRYDGLGRYGGEEFVVVLPNTEEETAAQLLNRLRVQFAQSAIEIPGQEPLSCTFSVGIASFPGCMEASQLIDAADQNLYRAKDQGRNRVVCDRYPASLTEQQVMPHPNNVA